MIDFSREIKFKTARSGGKGGQNVNKVETMVGGYWDPFISGYFTEAQKQVISEKLKNRINTDGFLMVKSQEHRTQLSNKETVRLRMLKLVNDALIVPKKRKPTKIPKAIKEKRLDQKKKIAERKEGRKKIDL